MTENTANADLNKALTKATMDEEFRAQLISDPKATLIAEGVNVPEGVGVQLEEISESRMVVVLPPLDEGTGD